MNMDQTLEGHLRLYKYCYKILKSKTGSWEGDQYRVDLFVS